ncbi:transposase [Candidatus Berkiella cookevillensis]|uniref:Transposase n=1 Tax=Candidatus Berkiella cookevillensis TaxID=437022 RepID=A0A0Q9Y8W6_9GAMM|nr:transposase [Candidatus Berkiella cookevillensis]MCS5708797.1 transposase [Candidatus Berkiella cookevillensis]
MGRRAFTPEFRNESASLVLDDGYMAKEAANTVGIGHRQWNDGAVS